MSKAKTAATQQAQSAKRAKAKKPRQRPSGLYKGQIWIAPDFNDPLPDWEEAFSGKKPEINE